MVSKIDKVIIFLGILGFFLILVNIFLLIKYPMSVEIIEIPQQIITCLGC